MSKYHQEEALTRDAYSVNKDRTVEKLKAHIAALQSNEELKDKVPSLVKWYPQEGMVYSFNDLSRVELRQNPALKVSSPGND